MSAGEQVGRAPRSDAEAEGPGRREAWVPSRTAWVGIAANAGSGRGGGRRQVERLVEALDQQGLGTRIAWTQDERSSLVTDSATDSGCRCLVAVGGDGTVAALVNERPSVPITVLPAGTENLFARHFGLGRDPARLAETIAGGRVAHLDLGDCGARRFALMAGIGFDADVVTRHHLARVGHAGVVRPTNRGAYVESVLRSTLAYRFPPLTLTIADPGAEETLVGANAFLFNLPRYALGLPFAPRAVGDDGWLDLVVFREAGALHALRYLGMVMCGLHLKCPGIEYRKVHRLVVSSAETVPVQLDGDPGGYIDRGPGGLSAFEVIPGAIDVLVPVA